jgi:hypothetical protein
MFNSRASIKSSELLETVVEIAGNRIEQIEKI